MPYVLEDEEKEKGVGQEVISPQGALVGAQGGNQAAPNKQTNSGFTNLRQYLDVNEPQSQGMAEKISSGVSEKGESIKTDLGQRQEAFNQNLAQNTIAPDENLYNKVRTAPTKLTTQEQERFKNTYSAKPQFESLNVADFQPRQDELQQNLKDINEPGSLQGEAGRFKLLNESYGRPSYSQGSKMLDQALLQASPGARSEFQSVRDRYKDINDQIKTASQNAAMARQQAEAQTNQALTGAKTAADTTISDILKAVEAEKARQQDAINKGSTQTLFNDLNATQLYNKLGIKPNNLVYVNPLDYTTYTPQTLTNENVASQRQYDQLAALAGLTGQSPLMGERQDVGSLYDFNRAGYDQAIQDALANIVPPPKTAPLTPEQQYQKDFNDLTLDQKIQFGGIK